MKTRDQNPDVGRDSDGVSFSDPLHTSPDGGGPVSLDLQMFLFSPGTVRMRLMSLFFFFSMLKETSHIGLGLIPVRHAFV